MKGPYSIEETEYLKSLISFGLKNLKDVGKGVNYEEFCTSIISSITENYYAPEFIKYWDNWHETFKDEGDDEIRKKIFETCIRDLKKRGIMTSEVSGLTGDFSELIIAILDESPSD